jgi:hypothetical protein
MTYGQMLMAFFATMLLSMYVLNINKNSVSLDVSINEYQFREIAANIAQSLIDDAQNKKFDENTLTYSTTLGPETGETASDPNTFDDFDDYNRYTNSTTPQNIQLYTETGKTIAKAIFRDSCIVKYVAANNLNTPLTGTTTSNYKRMEVRVWSDSFINPYTNKADTVKLYTICGKWPIN